MRYDIESLIHKVLKYSPPGVPVLCEGLHVAVTEWVSPFGWDTVLYDKSRIREIGTRKRTLVSVNGCVWVQIGVLDYYNLEGYVNSAGVAFVELYRTVLL